MNTNNSHQLYKKARGLMPGGVNSPVRAWKSVGGEPIFIESGKGSKITDADGNKYIDYIGSWGPLILGHAEKSVIRKISTTANTGTTFGAPTKLEIALSEKIQKAIPSIEMIRFVNSGTEATMSAIRLARAYTRKDRIIKFIGGYHGHADFLLAKAGSGVTTFGLPDSAGVPKQFAATTLSVPYNNSDDVVKLFKTYKNEIAAVIIEPVAGNIGVVPPKENFLEDLREITRLNNSLLIFDEVITGFRVGWGGAQGLNNIKPDLTCLGKIIGGGLPIGAYGGKKEIMKLVTPTGPVYQAGTLSGNPLAIAAGIATLDKIKSIHNAYHKLENMSSKLEKGLLEAAREVKEEVIINRVGSMMTLFFTTERVFDYNTAKTSDTKKYSKFFHLMLEQKMYFPPSQFESFFVSLAHSTEDIEKTAIAAKKSFRLIHK